MIPLPYIPVTASGLVSLSVFLFCTGLLCYLLERRRLESLRAKISGRTGEVVGVGPADVYRLVKRGLAGLFRALGERFKPSAEEELSRKQKALVRAGFRSRNAPMVFWGVKGLLALMLAVSFLSARAAFFGTVPLSSGLLGAVALALAGLYLPEIWLRHMVGKRADLAFKGLPDALDLLVVCVESGMGLDQALARVGEEMRHDSVVVSQELKTLNLELRAGKSRSEALRAMAARMGLEDVDSLVTLLIQADLFGTSVAQTLRVYSDSLRTKRFQRAEEMAAKLPVKLMLPLILCIFPALFVVIGGPAVISLMAVVMGMK